MGRYLPQTTARQERKLDPLDLHSRRGKSALFAVLLLAAASGLGWFALILADPGFSAGTARRAAFLEGVPVAWRVGFFALCGLACLWAAYAIARSALRGGPIVQIRPDGIADLRRSPPRFIGWGEVEGITVDSNFIIVKRAGAGGVQLKLDLGKDQVAIPLGLVTTPRDDILAAIAARAPHLFRQPAAPPGG